MEVKGEHGKSANKIDAVGKPDVAADSIHGRLRVFIHSKGLTKAELSRILAMSYDKVASYTSGKAEPGSEFWRTLTSKFQDVDIGYLVTGVKGAVPINAEGRDVPIVDRIPAGPLAQGFGESGILGYIRTDIKDPDAFGLVVTGLSMSPGIQEGDVVLCSPRSPFVNGRVYAVVIGEGEQSLKRLRHDTRAKAFALIPDNKEFPTLYVPEEQMLRHVRVVEVRRDLQ